MQANASLRVVNSTLINQIKFTLKPNSAYKMQDSQIKICTHSIIDQEQKQNKDKHTRVKRFSTC